jgi:hypothetical protein
MTGTANTVTGVANTGSVGYLVSRFPLLS